MSTHGFYYQVKESRIFVRNRPKSLEIGAKGFDAEDEADAYLSVTDTFVVPPTGKIFVWFPWNEGRKPIPEMYYATNKALIWWVHYLKLKKIQIFCDGGSHRSVTVFGAFLRTYFPNQEAQEIVKNRTERLYDGTSQDEDHSGWAQPLEYIDSYLEDFPADRLLFKAMSQDYLGRLDSHSKGIYRLVKERYGDTVGIGDI